MSIHRQDSGSLSSRSELQLFFAPNTCALATLIVIEELQAPYSLRRLDFSKSEQRSPEYLAINPKGRVPALVTSEGTLTETPALLVYVAQAFGGAHLLPSSAFAFAQMQAFNSYLCSTVHVAHAHRMRGHRWADDEAAHESMRRKVPQSVTAAFALIEDSLTGSWVMGEHYTIADPYLFTLAQWLEADRADLSRLPRVLAHRDRVRERAAVQRALIHEHAT